MLQWLLRAFRVIIPVSLVTGIADSHGIMRMNAPGGSYDYALAATVLARSIDEALVPAIFSCIIWLALGYWRSAKRDSMTFMKVGLILAIIPVASLIPWVHRYLLANIECLREASLSFDHSSLRVMLRIAAIPVFVSVGTFFLLYAQEGTGQIRGSRLISRWQRAPRWVHLVFNSLLISSVVAVAGLHLFLGIHRPVMGASMSDKPNIIFIMMDTTRADHLSGYGYNRQTTPNLDRMARQCTRFTRAYSQAPWTLWSVSSFMTSKFPETLGFAGNSSGRSPGRLGDDCLTLAESLKSAGYVTGAISSNTLFGPEVNNAQGLDYYDGTTAESMKNSASVAVTSLAERWIDMNRSRRFFTFLLYIDPHDPYNLHDDSDFSASRYQGDFKRSCWLNNDKKKQKLAKRPEDLAQAIALYDSDIAYTDRAIGDLVDFLKLRGLYDNTLIIFLADHGEEFNEHGSFLHCTTLWNESLRVPLIVKSPGQRTGRVIDGAYPLTNVFPSILRTIGSAEPRHLSGHGLDFKNLELSRQESIFSATDYEHPLRSVIRYPYKYILRLDTKQGQLFNLSKDPVERADLSRIKPEVAQSLRGSLHDHIKEMVASRSKDVERAHFSHEQERMLRSLGYLQ